MERKFYWIYVTVFINILAFGMTFPILPLFAKSFEASSFQVGLLISVFSLMQFITAPLLGKMSDRFGRKPIFIFSIFTTAIALIFIGLSQNLPMVFIGMGLQGLGSAGVLPTALAYVADIAKGHERSKYISRVTGTFALGFMVGPSIGGFLGTTSLATPFIGAGIVSLINLGVIHIFLHETHYQRDAKLVIKEGLINPRSLLFAAKGHMGLLFLLLFAWSVYISNFILTTPLFTTEKFHFGTFEAGIFFSVVGFVAGTTQWFILPIVEKKIGDVKTIFLGLILLFVGQILAPFSVTVVLFYIIFILAVVGSALMRPSTNALLSKRTIEGQGATMGLAFSFESLGRILGPILLGYAIMFFDLSTPFYITSLIVFLTTLVFYKLEISKN